MNSTEKLIDAAELNILQTDLEETTDIRLQFKKRDGLLPVIVQEFISKQILMLGYTNKEAYEYTLAHKKAAFWSTSRNQLWVKGSTSGNSLSVNKIMVDCDQDALIYLVTLDGGGVCHTFDQTGKNCKACFYRTVEQENDALAFLTKMQ